MHRWIHFSAKYWSWRFLVFIKFSGVSTALRNLVPYFGLYKNLDSIFGFYRVGPSGPKSGLDRVDLKTGTNSGSSLSKSDWTQFWVGSKNGSTQGQKFGSIQVGFIWPQSEHAVKNIHDWNYDIMNFKTDTIFLTGYQAFQTPRSRQ